MKILIQFPTYSRAQKFLDVLKQYIDTCGEKHEIFFNINCDSDDLTMTDSHVQNQITKLLMRKSWIRGIVNFDKDTDKISAINDHIEGRDFDIVVCASDDMIPKAHSWDNEIAIAMKEHFPDLDGCVHFNDGNTEGKLITFSILGRKLYEYFGYVYHPDYKSLYCDDEFTQEVKRLGKERYIDKVIITHEHYSLMESPQHDNATQKTLYYSGRDQMVFNKRKELGFPKERITND
tara:strand:- start:1660 stop:2361 length:702 start_codon:yes stop_codon:yes gene_type:complete